MGERSDKVSSFVPAALMKRLSADAVDAPMDAHFSGAVLYADIVQYTVLAEKLCDQGTDGVSPNEFSDPDALPGATLIDLTNSNFVPTAHHTVDRPLDRPCT